MNISKVKLKPLCRRLVFRQAARVPPVDQCTEATRVSPGGSCIANFYRQAARVSKKISCAARAPPKNKGLQIPFADRVKKKG